MKYLFPILLFIALVYYLFIRPKIIGSKIADTIIKIDNLNTKIVCPKCYYSAKVDDYKIESKIETDIERPKEYNFLNWEKVILVCPKCSLNFYLKEGIKESE